MNRLDQAGAIAALGTRCRRAAERLESFGPARVDAVVPADLLLEAASLIRGYDQVLMLDEWAALPRPGWDEAATRAWCQALATQLPSEEIRPQQAPYLTRYFAAGWNPYTRVTGPAVYLHHFVGSDPADAVHSHPWTLSVSLILVGGYREERCGADDVRTRRDYRAGDINVLRPDDRHRIDLLTPDCWTLFLAGAFHQPWAFFPKC